MTKETFKIGDVVEVINTGTFDTRTKAGDVGKIVEDVVPAVAWGIDFGDRMQLVYKPLADTFIKKTSKKVGTVVRNFWAKEPQFKLIFNEPATVLFYNGKKYIVKATKGDKFDEEKGFLLAFAKAHGLGYREIENIVKAAKRGAK